MNFCPALCGLVLSLAAAGLADAAVIAQSFSRPVTPSINWIGPGTNWSYLIDGTRYFFDWQPLPLAVDLDGNGTTEFTLFRDTNVTWTMNVSMVGRNQLWSVAGGVAGNDFGTFAIAMDAGSVLGPGLQSADPWVGWHNDVDTRGASTLMQTMEGVPIAGDFLPSYPFEQKYMGLRFERNGQLHYGWVALSGYRWLGGEIHIHAWAWESEPDTPIHVGQIPEPGAAGLLAAAGSILLTRRHRRAGCHL